MWVLTWMVPCKYLWIIPRKKEKLNSQFAVIGLSLRIYNLFLRVLYLASSCRVRLYSSFSIYRNSKNEPTIGNLNIINFHNLGKIHDSRRKINPLLHAHIWSWLWNYKLQSDKHSGPAGGTMPLLPASSCKARSIVQLLNLKYHW